MSTVRQHLGLLWLMKNRLGNTLNPQYDHAWCAQASQFLGVHLDEVISIAGGAEIESFVSTIFPSIPESFPAAAEKISTAPSIAPRLPHGTLAPEADEFMRLMTAWRFADLGEKAFQAFDDVVRYIDSRPRSEDSRAAARYHWLTEIEGLRLSPPGRLAFRDLEEMNQFIDAKIAALDSRALASSAAPESEVQAAEAKLYRDLTGDAMALGYDSVTAALEALRRPAPAAPQAPARELMDPDIFRIADEIGLSYRTGKGIKLFARAIARHLSGASPAREGE
jgi:hypothetical protein